MLSHGPFQVARPTGPPMESVTMGPMAGWMGCDQVRSTWPFASSDCYQGWDGTYYCDSTMATPQGRPQDTSGGRSGKRWTSASKAQDRTGGEHAGCAHDPAI